MEPILRKRFRKYQKNIHNPKKENTYLFESARYALQSSENLYLFPKTLESIRRIYTRCLKRKGRVTVCAYPNVAFSKKSSEARMGKGKGAISHWLCKIPRGEVFFEIDGIGKNHLKDIRDVTKLLPTKFPGKLKELIHSNCNRDESKKKLSYLYKERDYLVFENIPFKKYSFHHYKKKLKISKKLKKKNI